MPATETTSTHTLLKTALTKPAPAQIQKDSKDTTPVATIRFTGGRGYDISLVHGEKISASQIEGIVIALWTSVQKARTKFAKEKRNGRS